MTDTQKTMDQKPSQPQGAGMMKYGLIVAMLVLILDQISKWWILKGLDLPALGSVELLPFLNFTMVWNRGISMGLITPDTMTGQILLAGGTVVIMAVLAVWLKKASTKVEGYALAAVLGGAAGNLIDRFFHGAVVDFVHFHAFDYHFYVFNLADAAISLGVVALLIDSFINDRLQRTEKNIKTTDKSSMD